MVETIPGLAMSLSALVICKGEAHYVGGYPHLISSMDTCTSWRFAYSMGGWRDGCMSAERLKNFDNITKALASQFVIPTFLMLDGCEIDIHIEFIEYCISHHVVASTGAMWEGGRWPTPF